MNDALRQKIAKKGRDKYFKFFNSTIVAEFIINKSLNINKKYFWEKKKLILKFIYEKHNNSYRRCRFYWIKFN